MLEKSADLRERVSDFLYHEAELADSNDYAGWLDLWASTCTYWVPCNEDDYDPDKHVSIILDDRARLEERCVRLLTPGVHAQEPRSRLTRIVGNIRVLETDDEAGSVEVACNVMLVEVRNRRKTVYGSRCRYTLLVVDDSFEIRTKKVMLTDNDEALGNLTFLI